MAYRLFAKGKKAITLKSNRLRIRDENSLTAIYMDIVRNWNTELRTTIMPAYRVSYNELITDDWLSSISEALIGAGSALISIASSLRLANSVGVVLRCKAVQTISPILDRILSLKPIKDC